MRIHATAVGPPLDALRVSRATRVERPQSARESESARPAEATGAARPGRELSVEEQREVARLRQRDAEVRAHEQAHKAAAGQHARGGPHYETERGPDGRSYAVGGEVQIDTSEVPGDPRATLLKMQQVQRAALAPAEPSPADRAVAAEAAATAARARTEIQAEARETRNGSEQETKRDALPGQHLDLRA